MSDASFDPKTARESDFTSAVNETLYFDAKATRAAAKPFAGVSPSVPHLCKSFYPADQQRAKEDQCKAARELSSDSLVSQ